MIRFAAVADVQYGNLDDKFGRRYRESYEKLLSISGEFSKEKPTFAMNFGDAYDSGWENALAIKELFDVSGKQGGVVWRHILGNHDFSVPEDRKAEVYGLFGLKKPGYYDFQLEDFEDRTNKWRVVVLNGNEVSIYASETSQEKEAAITERRHRKLVDGSEPQSYNGSVSKEQLKWLDKTLKKATMEAENVLVCSHFPLYASSSSFRERQPQLCSLVDIGVCYSDLGISTWNGREILETLDRCPNVKGYLAGHLHEGSYGERKNVAHITFKGLVETTKTAYAYVELNKKSIYVKGIGEQPSYEFNFE